MTNAEFIDFVVRDKKVPYDDNLKSLLKQYFKLGVEYFEKHIDFNYMFTVENLILPQGAFLLPLMAKVKHIQSVTDKSRKITLTGEDEAEKFYLAFSNSPGVPTMYMYSEPDDAIKFNRPADRNTEYIVVYYRYPDPIYLDDNEEHPILKEAFQLMLSYMGLMIERYYSDGTQLDVSNIANLIPLERYIQTVRQRRSCI